MPEDLIPPPPAPKTVAPAPAAPPAPGAEAASSAAEGTEDSALSRRAATKASVRAAATASAAVHVPETGAADSKIEAASAKPQVTAAAPASSSAPRNAMAAAAATAAAPSSGAAARVDGAAIRRAINLDSHPYGLRTGASTGGEHCWSLLGAETFQVRGENYLTDKVKVDAGPAVMDLMQVDLFLSNDKIGNIALRSDSWLRKARAAGDTRYYFVILYVTPTPPHIHLIFYLAVNQEKMDANPRVAKLWRQFTAHGSAADEFRNERWKVIPRIAEGAWMVQKAMGTKPALLAQKLTHTWIICDDIMDSPTTSPGSDGVSATPGGSGGAAAAKTVEAADTGCAAAVDFGARARGGSFITHTGPGPYLEADCDVSSSSMAYWLVSLLQQYAKHIVIDLGFAIEPREVDTLPEVVLASVRLSRIEITKPPVMSANPEDWVLGSLGVTHSSLASNSEEDDGDA